MKNVSMWYQKKPIPQLSIFCLIRALIIMEIYPFSHKFNLLYTKLKRIKITVSTSLWLVRKTIFTCQQKNVTCHNLYYISPICIYLYIIINARMRQKILSCGMGFFWYHIETFKFQDVSKSEFSWLIDDSNNYVMAYALLCLQKGRPRYCWQNRICHLKKGKTWKSCLS
jgi:hypothetical protein